MNREVEQVKKMYADSLTKINEALDRNLRALGELQKRTEQEINELKRDVENGTGE